VPRCSGCVAKDYCCTWVSFQSSTLEMNYSLSFSRPCSLHPSSSIGSESMSASRTSSILAPSHRPVWCLMKFAMLISSVWQKLLVIFFFHLRMEGNISNVDFGIFCFPAPFSFWVSLGLAMHSSRAVSRHAVTKQRNLPKTSALRPSLATCRASGYRSPHCLAGGNRHQP